MVPIRVNSDPNAAITVVAFLNRSPKIHIERPKTRQAPTMARTATKKAYGALCHDCWFACPSMDAPFPRHRLRRRDLRVQGRCSPVAEHSATDVAQHRPRVLDLRDDGAPHAAHARECGRCLAGPGAKTLLVARRIRDQRRGADLDLLVLHSDDTPADGHRGDARSGSPGSPVAMAASGLRSSCSHTGDVAGSTEGVVVARRAWQLTAERHFLVRRTSENAVNAKFAEFTFHALR